MLDKQYSRVIRWINRAQSMSADGKYSDAIMDVECARAELDDARIQTFPSHGIVFYPFCSDSAADAGLNR